MTLRCVDIIVHWTNTTGIGAWWEACDLPRSYQVHDDVFLLVHLILHLRMCSWTQVGSFEEVMMRMTGSSGNELAAWSQVMFVAPNLLRQAVLKDESAASTK